MFFDTQKIAKKHNSGQEIKQKIAKKFDKKIHATNIDKIKKCIIMICVRQKDKTMAAKNVFLPFWKFMGIIFVWFLFIEALKGMGLIKTK